MKLRKLTERHRLIMRRAFSARTMDEHRLRSGTQELPRTLGLWDIFFLGVGSIIGAGVFVLSGVAANELAGPAVTLSYLVAAVAALLSALCYAEMAVSLPIAGGAFNYISVTFGELAAWLVAWNMCLETTLSSAAVARGFASYMATLVGLSPSALRITAGPLQLDPAAALLILGLTLLLCLGTRESSIFNMVVSALNVASIVFVLCAGFPQAETANLAPFSPYGAEGVFKGAAVVFFSFIGFDYLANAAEEAKDPARHLPIGIVGSLGVAAVLYMLMALCIVMMVPYAQIDIHAPFSAAFLDRGMGWAARIVSLGAVLGIVTSTMTGLLGQSRLLVVLGRERLLPSGLAAISRRTGTPIVATALTGAMAAAFAFVVDIGILAELVSVGTLYVFGMVCGGVLFLRYHQRDSGSVPTPILASLLGMLLASLGASLSFTLGPSWIACTTFLALFGLALFSCCALPVVHVPEKFRVPFFPVTPALGLLFTVHLIGSLGWPAYVRFGVWMAAGLLVYALFGVHGAEEREREHIRELEEQRSIHPSAANGASDEQQEWEAPARPLRTLDHEAPVGSVELAPASALEVQQAMHVEEQQQRQYEEQPPLVSQSARGRRSPTARAAAASQRARLMSGHANSSAFRPSSPNYDPNED